MIYHRLLRNISDIEIKFLFEVSLMYYIIFAEFW